MFDSIKYMHLNQLARKILAYFNVVLVQAFEGCGQSTQRSRFSTHCEHLWRHDPTISIHR